jgi:hypothetical protein
LNPELPKSVIDVASRPLHAAGVSAATMGTGVSTYLEVLPPIVGLAASLAGLVLTILLGRNYIKKWELMDREIKIMDVKLKEAKDKSE